MYNGGDGGPRQAFQKQKTQAIPQELLAAKQPDQRARGAAVQDRCRDSPALCARFSHSLRARRCHSILAMQWKSEAWFRT